MLTFGLRHTVSTSCLHVFVLTVLAGQVVDRTTGQPLTGVDVRVRGGSAAVAPTRTNGAGRYNLRGVRPGHLTITVSSDDVPPQSFEVTVHSGKAQQFDITACSTTLDYSCAPAVP